MEKFYSDLQISLKQARENAGFSQNEAAERLQVSRQAISRWENGQSYPDIDHLQEMARLYGVSADRLLDKKDTSGTALDEPGMDTVSRIPCVPADTDTDPRILRAPAETGELRLKELLLILALLVATILHCIPGLLVSAGIALYIARAKSVRSRRSLFVLAMVGCALNVWNLFNIYIL